MEKNEKEEIEHMLSIWIVIGIIVCVVTIVTIADGLDLGIRGQQLFHSDNFIEDDMTNEEKESVIHAIENINNVFGGPAFLQSETFDFIVLPNLTNLGVLASMMLFCILNILWVTVGKKLLGRIYHCKFSTSGDVIEMWG